jgi:hypothetical protein
MSNFTYLGMIIHESLRKDVVNHIAVPIKLTET